MQSPNVREVLRAGGASLLGAALFLAAAGPALAADPDSRRLEKQIRLFESAVDEMLIDSPNFLVQNRDNTRGTYIEGRGVRFTFRTSLNSHAWGDDDGFWRVIHEKGHRFLVFGDDDDHDEKAEKRREDLVEREAKLYRKGKIEIVEVIADFGEVLSALADDEWLELEARLRDADYFRDEDLRKLTVRVRMGDLRAYAAGRLDMDEITGRMELKES